MNTQINPRMAESPVSQSFLNELAVMHDAEKQLTHALPLIVAAAKSPDLKTLLELHLEETKGHVKTIDAVAVSLKKDLPHKTCEPMKGFVKEGVVDIVHKLKESNQDAALMATGRKIEQFEIASYTALCAQAKDLGYSHEHALLTSTLNQEQLADALLAGLQKGGVPLKKLIEQASLKKAGATSP